MIARTSVKNRNNSKKGSGFGKNAARNKTLAYIRTMGPYPSASAGEKKNIDAVINSSSLAASSTTAQVVSCLNACLTGTTATTRNGRKIRLKSVLIKAEFYFLSPVQGNSPFRWLVVYDKQTNGANPAATDILTVDTIISPMNLTNSERFKVLADMHDELSSVSDGVLSMKRYIPLNLDTVFNTGTAGTVADIATGGLFLVVYANNLATSGTNYTGQIYTRVRFVDH